MQTFRRRFLTLVACVVAAHHAASCLAAVPNSLVINEANSVSGTQFLDEDNRNRGDLSFGRVEGNGQDWLEFLVVQGDQLPGGLFKNTLDLRGWKIEWSYDKNDPQEPHQSGSGVIQFTNDPLWAAVPKGSLVTMSEWKKTWYHDAGTDPGNHGGLQHDGGINGLGTTIGTQGGTTIDFSTNTTWNPNATVPGNHDTGDWTIHVWAGERNPDNSFKYFNFSGSVLDGNPTPIPIGTENGGLFVVNNDNWQWTIKDAANNVIQGPMGEALSNGVWSVNSQEIFRLENFVASANPTTSTYLGATSDDYQDGSSTAFGLPNVWSGGSFVQDLSPLRDWLEAGDITLDGAVTGDDFLAWQRGVGTTGASLTGGDLTGDGLVNGTDLAQWKTNFGASAIAATRAVPEPEAWGLMGIGLISALAWRISRARAF